MSSPRRRGPITTGCGDAKEDVIGYRDKTDSLGSMGPRLREDDVMNDHA
jgi:hypothetical protein